MLTPYCWNNLSDIEKKHVLARPRTEKNQNLQQQVSDIISAVRSRGDAACKAFTAQFDGVTIDRFTVSQNEFKEARARVSAKTIFAMENIIQQLTAFHLPQRLQKYSVTTCTGVKCENEPRAIERVGLYVPAGSAPLVSTVLMLAVPAQIAGCTTRVLCSPPNKQTGTIDPHILVAAELCGITQVYKIGGAQAIAAIAYGTETIPKVDKIFGPGNAWVTQAKMLVAQDGAGAFYDMPAGPSEVMVIADDLANPNFIAADLLSQAEHDSDSQVMLITTSQLMVEQVIAAMKQQIISLPRQEIARKALQNSRVIVVDNILEAITIANRYAPEHLILQVTEPRQYVDKIQHAGSVFLGAYSPEAAGDYASGTNHVLPTFGYARTLSGLTVRDFMKTISFQELTPAGLNNIATSLIELADVEGLAAHKRAVTIRLEECNRNAK